MTLQELTKQESGIVIYSNGDAIVCNWSTVCEHDNELPKLFFDVLVGWDVEEFILDDEYKVEDWRDEFRKIDRSRGITVLYDRNGDLVYLEGCPAHVFRLDDSTIIIAPEDWN